MSTKLQSRLIVYFTTALLLLGASSIAQSEVFVLPDGATFAECRDLIKTSIPTGNVTENFTGAAWNATRNRVARGAVIPTSAQEVLSKGMLWRNPYGFYGTLYGALLTSTLDNITYSLSSYDPNISVFDVDDRQIAIESNTTKMIYGVCVTIGSATRTTIEVVLDDIKTVELGSFLGGGYKKMLGFIDTDGFNKMQLQPKLKYLESGVVEKIVHVYAVDKIFFGRADYVPYFDVQPPAEPDSPNPIACGPGQIEVIEDDGIRCEDAE